MSIKSHPLNFTAYIILSYHGFIDVDIPFKNAFRQRLKAFLNLLTLLCDFPSFTCKVILRTLSNDSTNCDPSRIFIVTTVRCYLSTINISLSIEKIAENIVI